MTKRHAIKLRKEKSRHTTPIIDQNDDRKNTDE